MAPEKAPAFQLYPKDFTDGTVDLSAEEVGAYFRLLCYQWGKGAVPNDLTAQARIAGVAKRRMATVWDRIQRHFGTTPSGDFVNARLERERDKQEAYRRQQAENGKRGGRPPKATENPTLKPNESQSQSEPKAEPKAKKSSSSAICDLQSASFGKSVRGHAGGVMAGSLPRDHLRHAFCGRLCVPEFLHGDFVRQVGGAEPETVVREFYVAVLARLPDDQPIGDEPVKFWRAQFTARFGSTAVGKTAGNATVAERFIARGNA